MKFFYFLQKIFRNANQKFFLTSIITNFNLYLLFINFKHKLIKK